MYSVTERVEMVKQPRGGYLKTGMFVREECHDGIALNGNENINPSIEGLVVDYLTRFLSGTPIREAFQISLIGANILDRYKGTNEEINKAYSYLTKINGLTDQSIINACKLVGYDVCYRDSCNDYNQKGLIPDEFSISSVC